MSKKFTWTSRELRIVEIPVRHLLVLRQVGDEQHLVLVVQPTLLLSIHLNGRYLLLSGYKESLAVALDAINVMIITTIIIISAVGFLRKKKSQFVS